MKINRSFTLIELIVVVALLVVISAVAFISVTKWIWWSRNTKRVWDLKNISISLFSEYWDKIWDYPEPWEWIWIYDLSGNLIAKQWLFNENPYSKVADVLSELPKDPLWEPNDGYYGYTSIVDWKWFELVALLEDIKLFAERIVQGVYAEWITRIPYVLVSHDIKSGKHKMVDIFSYLHRTFWFLNKRILWTWGKMILNTNNVINETFNDINVLWAVVKWGKYNYYEPGLITWENVVNYNITTWDIKPALPIDNYFSPSNLRLDSVANNLLNCDDRWVCLFKDIGTSWWDYIGKLIKHPNWYYYGIGILSGVNVLFKLDRNFKFITIKQSPSLYRFTDIKIGSWNNLIIFITEVYYRRWYILKLDQNLNFLKGYYFYSRLDPFYQRQYYFYWNKDLITEDNKWNFYLFTTDYYYDYQYGRSIRYLTYYKFDNWLNYITWDRYVLCWWNRWRQVYFTLWDIKIKDNYMYFIWRCSYWYTTSTVNYLIGKIDLDTLNYWYRILYTYNWQNGIRLYNLYIDNNEKLYIAGQKADTVCSRVGNNYKWINFVSVYDTGLNYITWILLAYTWDNYSYNYSFIYNNDFYLVWAHRAYISWWYYSVKDIFKMNINNFFNKSYFFYNLSWAGYNGLTTEYYLPYLGKIWLLWYNLSYTFGSWDIGLFVFDNNIFNNLNIDLSLNNLCNWYRVITTNLKTNYYYNIIKQRVNFSIPNNISYSPIDFIVDINSKDLTDTVVLY